MGENPRIVVVGDVMLDIYRYGEVDRISPEAPVPIILIEKSIKNLGGAGNTFANLYALNNIYCFLMGIVGRDQYGTIDLPNLIREKYPSADYNLYPSANHDTIIKERIIARTQQICRLDRENVNAVLEENEDLPRVKKILEFNLKYCDILIISDYAKGFITPHTMSIISKMKKEKNFIVLLDPHPKNALIYSDIDYATPNKKEFDEIQIGKFWDIGCKAIIRTEGAEGMTIIQQDDANLHLKTVAQEIFDVSGAGDTVIAVLGYMLAHKFNLINSVIAANECAGIVVSKPGTIPITRNEFNKILRRFK